MVWKPNEGHEDVFISVLGDNSVTTVFAMQAWESDFVSPDSGTQVKTRMVACIHSYHSTDMGAGQRQVDPISGSFQPSNWNDDL